MDAEEQHEWFRHLPLFVWVTVSALVARSS